MKTATKRRWAWRLAAKETAVQPTTMIDTALDAEPPCGQYGLAPGAGPADSILQAFNVEVRRHLLAMPDAEWSRLRGFGNSSRRFINSKDVAMPNLTRDELVERFVSLDNCSIDEVLLPEFRAGAIEIAQIEGSPLFYVEGEGIFVMGEDFGGVPMTRALWVTHPAYPPTW
jgi:hypothetical protein